MGETHEDDDGTPAWSPDGQQIAFVSLRDGNYEIYVMNADGSALTRLTNNAASDLLPRWRPQRSREDGGARPASRRAWWRAYAFAAEIVANAIGRTPKEGGTLTVDS